jgi:glycosyltransferase involved in cell wall biosynthesis
MRLLKKLERQETEGIFDYSIVIVDNDKSEAARQVAESCNCQLRISIKYYVEPQQNIALARNKAVENAIGDFVAFIDDDETPKDDWLLNLYRTFNNYETDGVLGPVIPHFETKPPAWIINGKIFERPLHKTGTFLNWENTRTGNVLLKRHVFEAPGSRFDPAYGSGGEDRDFFKRMISKGFVFVWCAEAPVYELVVPGRCQPVFMMKRALLRGKVSLNYCTSFDIMKSIMAIVQYTLSLPILFILSYHYFMKFLIKDLDHLGRIMAFCGIDVIKDKYMVE